MWKIINLLSNNTIRVRLRHGDIILSDLHNGAIGGGGIANLLRFEHLPQISKDLKNNDFSQTLILILIFCTQLSQSNIGKYLLEKITENIISNNVQ